MAHLVSLKLPCTIGKHNQELEGFHAVPLSESENITFHNHVLKNNRFKSIAWSSFRVNVKEAIKLHSQIDNFIELLNAQG